MWALCEIINSLVKKRHKTIIIIIIIIIIINLHSSYGISYTSVSDESNMS